MRSSLNIAMLLPMALPFMQAGPLEAQQEPATAPEQLPANDMTQNAAADNTEPVRLDFAARVAAHPGDAYSPEPPWPGAIVVPDIVRPEHLPMRMYHDPELQRPLEVTELDERLVPVSVAALTDAADLELREVGGQQLVRIAGERYADISSTFPALRKLLNSDDHVRLRRVCALALAEGNATEAADDLVRATQQSEISDQIVIERALARWKSPAAADMWRKRLTDDFMTNAAVRLACEGLTALGDQQSVPLLVQGLRRPALEYAKRTAMARALCQLDQAVARSEAARLRSGSIPDRLLAVELFNHRAPEAFAAMEQLCDDPDAPVAAAAWIRLLPLSPEHLQAHLMSGRGHHDAVVRETASRVMGLFPMPERLNWLQTLMSDRHLKVRNVARQMLDRIAHEHPDLLEPIVANAAATLHPESDDWQGIEQSLALLGSLRKTQFSPVCVSLLQHKRGEVRAAAAWLIHLFPDSSIEDAVRSHVFELEERLLNPAIAQNDPPEKMAFLVQYCGLMRLPELLPLYMTQFSETAPGGPDKRAACMWAIGLLHERNPVPDLVQKLEDRVKDRIVMPVEVVEVRRTAALALGLMRAKAAIPTVEEAFHLDGPGTLLPANAQWILPLLGVPMPADLELERFRYTGWRLLPASPSRSER